MLKALIRPRLAMLLALLFPLLSGCELMETRPDEPPAAAAEPVSAPVSAPATKKPVSTTSRPAKPTPAPTADACGVKVTQDRDELAQTYYVKGERMFNDDNIGNAKQALRTAVCLNPKHKQAADLLQLLEKTYPKR